MTEEKLTWEILNNLPEEERETALEKETHRRINELSKEVKKNLSEEHKETEELALWIRILLAKVIGADVFNELKQEKEDKEAKAKLEKWNKTREELGLKPWKIDNES